MSRCWTARVHCPPSLHLCGARVCRSQGRAWLQLPTVCREGCTCWPPPELVVVHGVGRGTPPYVACLLYIRMLIDEVGSFNFSNLEEWNKPDSRRIFTLGMNPTYMLPKLNIKNTGSTQPNPLGPPNQTHKSSPTGAREQLFSIAFIARVTDVFFFFVSTQQYLSW